MDGRDDDILDVPFPLSGDEADERAASRSVSTHAPHSSSPKAPYPARVSL